MPTSRRARIAAPMSTHESSGSRSSGYASNVHFTIVRARERAVAVGAHRRVAAARQRAAAATRPASWGDRLRHADRLVADVQAEVAAHREVRLADRVREQVAQALLDRHARQRRALGRDRARRGLEVVRDDEADAVRRQIRRRAPASRSGRCRAARQLARQLADLLEQRARHLLLQRRRRASSPRRCRRRTAGHRATVSRAPPASTAAANAASSFGSVPTASVTNRSGRRYAIRLPTSNASSRSSLLPICGAPTSSDGTSLLALGAEADRVRDAQAVAGLLQPHHRRRIDREHARDVLDDAADRARIAIEIRAASRR